MSPIAFFIVSPIASLCPRYSTSILHVTTLGQWPLPAGSLFAVSTHIRREVTLLPASWIFFPYLFQFSFCRRVIYSITCVTCVPLLWCFSVRFFLSLFIYFPLRLKLWFHILSVCLQCSGHIGKLLLTRCNYSGNLSTHRPLDCFFVVLFSPQRNNCLSMNQMLRWFYCHKNLKIVFQISSFGCLSDYLFKFRKKSIWKKKLETKEHRNYNNIGTRRLGNVRSHITFRPRSYFLTKLTWTSP